MIAPHSQSLAASAMSRHRSGMGGSQYYRWYGPDIDHEESAATLAPRMAGPRMHGDSDPPGLNTKPPTDTEKAVSWMTVAVVAYAAWWIWTHNK